MSQSCTGVMIQNKLLSQKKKLKKKLKIKMLWLNNSCDDVQCLAVQPDIKEGVA